MNDQELNAALRGYSEAWSQYVSPPAMQGMEPVLRAQARAAINKLQAEASRVPAPGGLISDYSDALAAWAATNHMIGTSPSTPAVARVLSILAAHRTRHVSSTFRSASTFPWHSVSRC